MHGNYSRRGDEVAPVCYGNKFSTELDTAKKSKNVDIKKFVRISSGKDKQQGITKTSEGSKLGWANSVQMATNLAGT